MTAAGDDLILAIDLGTTVAKVDLWARDGGRASSRAEVPTRPVGHGRIEQDAESWWASIVDAAERMTTLDRVVAVAVTSARQTFVPVDERGAPVGPAIVWSDARAGVEAAELGDPADARRRTGHHLDGSAVAAKLRWLARHRPEQLADAAWILSPRDFIVARLTGISVTDVTMASATGCYDGTGCLLEDLVGGCSHLFPPVVASTEIVATTERLGLPAGTPVVIGAGDRPCEVRGAGATPSWPMVSWGTTANASLPIADRPQVDIPSANLSRAATVGWLIEWGLSAAGSMLAWLARLTGRSIDELLLLAATSPPGANDAHVLPWFGGARAPWWRRDAAAAVVGLTPDHGPGDLTRALFEGTAREITRCLATYGLGSIAGLSMAGGADTSLWLDALSGVSGRPVRVRRSSAAASVGAALLAADALDLGWTVDQMNPVVAEREPDARLVERYAELTPRADEVARMVLDGGRALDVRPHPT